jgi:hypothetical protein
MPYVSEASSRRRRTDAADGAVDLVRLINGGHTRLRGAPHQQDHDLRLEY